jgi:hypothetical protein
MPALWPLAHQLSPRKSSSKAISACTSSKSNCLVLGLGSPLFDGSLPEFVDMISRPVGLRGGTYVPRANKFCLLAPERSVERGVVGRVAEDKIDSGVRCWNY